MEPVLDSFFNDALDVLLQRHDPTRTDARVQSIINALLENLEAEDAALDTSDLASTVERSLHVMKAFVTLVQESDKGTAIELITSLACAARAGASPSGACIQAALYTVLSISAAAANKETSGNGQAQ